MERIIKFISNESTFNATQNLVNLVIPSGTYDLSQSYVNMIFRLTTDANGIYNVGFQYKNVDGSASDIQPYNICLVKNASMRSSNKGQLASVRRPDIHRSNLNEMLLSEQEKDAKEYKNLVTSFDVNTGLIQSPFVQMNGEGTIASKYVDHNVQIPLSQIFDIGQVRNFNVDKLGQTTISLELQLEKLVLTQFQKSGTNNKQFGREEYTKFADIPVDANNAQNVSELKVNQKVEELKDSPYYVGMRLKFTYNDDDGSNPATSEEITTTISGISYDRGTKELKLTLATPIQLAAGHSANTIACDGVDATKKTFDCNQIELVMKQVAPTKERKMLYAEYTTTEHNGNGQTNFQHQFLVERQALGVFIMFPSDETDLNSINSNITSFRLRMDDKDLCDRDITIRSPLYYDRLTMSLINSNLTPKSLNLTSHAATQTTADKKYSTDTHKLVVISAPLPLRKNGLLQVNINAPTNGIKQMILYKHVPRSISV